ncbi:MAG TPA: hypothetical protein VL122_00995 [Nitrospirota bacterium]|nr:hypothetical protein [Nitrospirota bacterium]
MQTTKFTILWKNIRPLAISLSIAYVVHRTRLPALIGVLITDVLMDTYGAELIPQTCGQLASCWS